jgi:uncharacterized protein
MSFETAQLAVDRMGSGPSPFTLQFAGGEPLLNLALMEKVMGYTRQRRPDARFSVQTNGTLLDEKAAALFKRYRVAIGVSLDGKVETNEMQRGCSAGTLSGILLLRDCGLSVNITTVVTRENAEKLREIVDMAVYLQNVRGIGLDLLRKAGRAAETASPVRCADGDALKRGIQALYCHLKEVNRLLPRPIIVREFEKARYQLSRGDNGGGEPYCYASLGDSFVVLPDGDCYPCGSLAGNRRYRMGNIRTGIIPRALGCSRPPEKCSACTWRKFCTGGCPSRGLLVGGFDELDCVMKRTAFEVMKNEELRVCAICFAGLGICGRIIA